MKVIKYEIVIEVKEESSCIEAAKEFLTGVFGEHKACQILACRIFANDET